MKKNLLVVVFLIFSYSYGNSKDSIDFSLFTEQTETFVTVHNQGKKMVRWQNYTAEPLTIYQMPSEQVIAVYENPISKTLIGLSEKEILIWNIDSSEITKRFSIKDIIPNLKKINNKIVYRFLSDYIPEKDLMVFTSENTLFVININNQELLFEKQLDNQLSYPKFLLKENILVIEKTSVFEETLLVIDIQKDQTKKITSAHKIITAVNDDRTQYSVFMDNSLTSYNVQHQKVNQTTLQESLFLREGSMCYTSSGFVVLPYLNSLKFLSTSDNSSRSVYYEKEYDKKSFDTENNMLLFHNGSTVFISSIIGEVLFETELADIDFIHKNTSLNINEVNDLVKTEQRKITSVLSVNNSYYATTNTGVLNIYDKNKVLTDSVVILGTAITHSNFIDNETAFLAGYGRGSFFNVKKKEHIRVLNGHSSNIISSLKLSDVFLLTAGQDKKIVLWDMNKGVYVADLKSDRTPLSLSKKNNNQVIITYTDGSSQEWDLSNHINQYLNPPREMLLSTTHSKNIIDLEFFPERDLMLSTDFGGYVKIWDVRSMVPYLTIKPGNENMISAVFNPEFNEVLAYGQSKIYHIDVVSGKIKRETNIPPLYNNNVFFHKLSVYPNTSMFVVNNNKSNSQFAYHSGSGLFYNFVTSNGKYAPYGIASDIKNERVAFYGSESVDIWSLNDLKNPIKQIRNNNNSNQNMYARRKIDFSPSGNKIMYERDTQFIVYDLISDREVLILDDYIAVIFTDDNHIVYCIAERENIFSNVQMKLTKYDFRTEKIIFSVEIEDYYAIRDMKYDSTKNILALAYSNGDIEFLDADRGVSIKRISIKSEFPKTKYNVANGYVTTTVPGAVLVFDWKHLKLNKTIDYKTRSGIGTSNYTFSPDGKYFVQSYSDKVEFYDAKSFKLLFDFPLKNQEGSGKIKISEDNKYIAFSDYLQGAHIYEIQTKSLVYKIEPDKNDLVTDYELLTDNTDAHIWIMIQKPKSDKEQSENQNQGGIPKNKNTYISIYDLNKKQKHSEILLGDSNHLWNFSFTKNKNYIFFESEWKEITIIDINNKKTFKHKVSIDNSMEKIYSSPDESNIIITDNLGYLHFMNMTSGEISQSVKASKSKISDISFFKNNGNNYMITCSEEGSSKIWNYDAKDELVTLLAFSRNDYMFLTPDNYYSGTRAVVDAVHFKEKGKIYSFEQFDLFYNRPDIVLKGLNDNIEIQNIYLSAYQRRLKALGYNADIFNPNQGFVSVPDIFIERNNIDIQTQDKNFSFSIQGSDQQYSIKKLHVWVNGVPIYGVNGFDITASAKSIHQTVSLELSSGLNTIKASVVNEKGIESLKESFYVTYIGEVPRNKTYYIGIGVSNYKDARYNLTYATKDITDLDNTFSDRYDNYVNYQLSDSMATRQNILSLKNELSKTSVDDVVIISFSGHGVLDDDYNWYYATYDMDFDKPSVSGLRYEEIELLLDGIPSRKKILLIDACHSGEVDKEYITEISQSSNNTDIVSIPVGGKGSQPINVSPKTGMQNSFDLMRELFANLSKSNGSVVISASGGMEYAFEGNIWNNGVFTYSFINGLKHSKADQNKDGKITINEIKSYVSQQVETLTNGKQKPTSRQENIESDFEL